MVERKIEIQRRNDLLVIGMAAHYDPDASVDLKFRMPMDLTTGELIPERWEQWLKHDPVRLIDKHASNLKKLRGIYVECGTYDQYRLLWGSRMLHKKLSDYSIEHCYEEFPDNHSDLDYRLSHALPFLYEKVSQAM